MKEIMHLNLVSLFVCLRGGMRLSLILLTVVMLARPAAAQTPPASLPAGPHPDSLAVGEALDLVLAFQLSNRQAEYAARRAGASGDPSYSPRLRQIAEIYAGTEHDDIALNALHALWELGEPEAYFLDHARNWPQNVLLASNSIRMLGRAPDSTTVQELQSLAVASDSIDIQGAVNDYRTTLRFSAQYQGLPLAEKMDFLFWRLTDVLTTILDTADSLIIAEGTDDGDLDAYTLWARDRLRELAHQQPDSVQTYIDALSEWHYFDRYDLAVRSVIAEGFERYVGRVAFSPGRPLPEGPVEITLDNADATGVTLVGDWTESTSSTGGGPFGANYLHDGNADKGTKSVTFTPDVPVSGLYEVYLYWNANANRATNTPIDITYSFGTATVVVDQQTSGGQFNLLGTFSFDAGTAGSIQIRTDDTDGFVIADAVRLVKIAPQGNLLPEAGFTADPASGAAPLTVTFDAASSYDPDGALVSYAWDFGDGQSGSGASVVHDYPVPGDYEVILTVTDADEATDADTTTISVGALEITLDNAAATGATLTGEWTVSTATTGGGPFGADYLHDGNADKGTKSVTFTPDVPVNGIYEVYLYWNSNANRSTRTPVDIAHTFGTTTVVVDQQQSGGQFNRLGTFSFDAGTAGSIQIRTDDTDGFVIADAVRLVLDSADPGINREPVAGFIARPEAGPAPLTVDLDASPSYDPDGPIVTYAWDFGDGQAGSGQTVSHLYGTPGDYAVILTITDTDGATDADTTTISVGDVEVTVDNADATGVTLVGDWTTSTATTGGGPFGADYFHDGNADKGTKSVTFTPTVPIAGLYAVYLYWNNHPNRSTRTPVDIVHTFGTTVVVIDQQAIGGQFSLLGTFSFDAGTAGSIQIRTDDTDGFVIADAVRLVKIDPQGNLLPEAGFSADPVSGPAPLSVAFDASASHDPDGPIVTYAWDFGDGQTGSGQATSHTYTTPGTYEAILTVTDQDGASDADTTTISVSNLELVLDNADATGVTLVGDWTVSTSSTGGGPFGANYLHDGNADKGTKSVTFTPDVPVSGVYEVYLYWSSNANRATNTPIDVAHVSGTTTVVVDQQQNGGQFNLLGTFSFDAGTAGSIQIRTDDTDGFVIADAVRLVLTGN